MSHIKAFGTSGNHNPEQDAFNVDAAKTDVAAALAALVTATAHRLSATEQGEVVRPETINYRTNREQENGEQL